MKVVFMGTPDFAVPSLEELYEAGHEIAYVVTQPDAVRDRGRELKFSPVKEKALALGLEVLQPERVRGNEGFMDRIKACGADAIVVAAYGQILPKEFLDIPPLGCVNVHGSLLPRFRGAAPIQRAIMEGDKETGITIMFMAEGIDTGDMLAKESTPIGKKTGQQLHDELAVIGAKLLVETLPKLENIKGEKQKDEDHTYAPMISKKEGHVNFAGKPEEIERLIRAFDPWPGAYAYMADKMIKFWKAQVPGQSTDAENGTVVAFSPEGLDIAAGGEILRITEIQVPGKKIVAIKEYLKGNSIEIGTVLI
ncbi:MAG: methionyl-tRNA formyltransferase [Clostridiales bacterium]|nr:methionyl-tRNA formyltransferase [Clostridiales bacterium]